MTWASTVNICQEDTFLHEMSKKKKKLFFFITGFINQSFIDFIALECSFN